MNAIEKNQDPPRPVVRILCGPTGVGKSSVALECAERLGAHIVSLDAMKVYRGMDIGTAKPSPAELARVPHHCLSFLDVNESGSMGLFIERAESVIRSLCLKGIPVVCDGGSIMYVKGLVEGFFDAPGRDKTLRAQYRAAADADGVESLHTRLASVDPVSATRIGPRDYKRIERALEVFDLTGRPISEQQTQWGAQRTDFDIRLVGLRRDRAVLYERINARTPVMLDAGWIEECRRLLERNDLSREARMAHGYRAVFAYLNGDLSEEAMIESIRLDTRHYARRQLSWFSKFPGLRWVDASETESIESLADRVLAEWSAMGS